jgi:hypothetical protein
MPEDIGLAKKKGHRSLDLHRHLADRGRVLTHLRSLGSCVTVPAGVEHSVKLLASNGSGARGRYFIESVPL